VGAVLLGALPAGLAHPSAARGVGALMLSFSEIKELLELVSARGFVGLEVEEAGFRLRVEGSRPSSHPDSPDAPRQTAPDAPRQAPVTESLHIVTSPVVGAFYAAPSAEAQAFVEIGQEVKPGQVLCIIESMNLKNEIESDVAGEVLEVFARAGQRVELGEKLFAIRARRLP
jgi:acetyl-CoA carboxylase biotin carboxyl carrier protein